MHGTTGRSLRWQAVGGAGSERVGRSEAAGQQLREAQAINRSLAALGDVIAALQARQSHVPFRNSKLTSVRGPRLMPVPLRRLPHVPCT